MEEENNLQQFLVELKDILTELKLLMDPYKSKSIIITDYLYNNKEIKQLLGVDEKVIKGYRDNGFISFHRINDKYWYLGKDIMEFLKRIRYEAF